MNSSIFVYTLLKSLGSPPPPTNLILSELSHYSFIKLQWDPVANVSVDTYVIEIHGDQIKTDDTSVIVDLSNISGNIVLETYTINKCQMESVRMNLEFPMVTSRSVTTTTVLIPSFEGKSLCLASVVQ